MLNEKDLPGTMAQRLKPYAPGPGEEIYEDSILEVVTQYVKQRLPDKAARRAHLLPGDGL